jgi:hypothetical protein
MGEKSRRLAPRGEGSDRVCGNVDGMLGARERLPRLFKASNTLREGGRLPSGWLWASLGCAPYARAGARASGGD